MDLELAGKRAFVSGSSSGLGQATALELAAEGCDVVVHGRDRERTEETARQIEALGRRAVVTTGDLAEVETANRIAADAIAGLGGIDILVNNCGAVLHMDNPHWSELDPEEWVRSYRVNFISALCLSQKFAPGMKERGWGRIINISSTESTNVEGLLMDYAAPKAALNNFTANASKDLGPHGVTINTVIPGIFHTPSVDRWMVEMRKEFGWTDDFAENERICTSELLTQSVRRFGRPKEIAVIVAYLASPHAGYTNGASIRADGGHARFI
jgi:3-oxoacyl-[acyl-carrier protein] reductase